MALGPGGLGAGKVGWGNACNAFDMEGLGECCKGTCVMLEGDVARAASWGEAPSGGGGFGADGVGCVIG